jgi:hypothetical protein
VTVPPGLELGAAAVEDAVGAGTEPAVPPSGRERLGGCPPKLRDEIRWRFEAEHEEPRDPRRVRRLDARPISLVTEELSLATPAFRAMWRSG